MVRIGIVGCGGISNAHMNGYNNLENIEVVACCDMNLERAKEYSLKYGITSYYNNHKEMLEKEKLDGISVCTWNNSHAEISIDGLNAGVNVLCEKPLAMNTEQALEIQDAAKKTGKLLMVGFVRRFGKNTTILKDFTEKGLLGEIYYAKTGCLRRCGNPTGWFSDISKSGGGPLIDLGVHMIDLCRYIMGKPVAIQAFGATFDKLGTRLDVKMMDRYSPVDKGELCNVEDFAKAMIRFDNGAILSVEVSFSLHIEKDILFCELYGTKAGAVIEPAFKIISNMEGYDVDITPKYSVEKNFFSDIFVEEIKHFADCIEDKCECICPVEDGVELMRILDAIYESAKTKKEVYIKGEK